MILEEIPVCNYLYLLDDDFPGRMARLKYIKSLRWGFGTNIPHDIRRNMSETESKWLESYNGMLFSYMSTATDSGIDLCQDRDPPKFRFIMVSGRFPSLYPCSTCKAYMCICRPTGLKCSRSSTVGNWWKLDPGRCWLVCFNRESSSVKNANGYWIKAMLMLYIMFLIHMRSGLDYRL